MGESKREKRQLVEDFRRFLQIWSLICKVSDLEPQNTAENRRKPQEIAGMRYTPVKRDRHSLKFPILKHVSAPGKWGRPRRGVEKFLNQTLTSPGRVQLNSGRNPLKSPDLPFLAFLEFLPFFLSKEFLLFFPVLSQGF